MPASLQMGRRFPVCAWDPWGLCNYTEPWAQLLENLKGQFWAQTQESGLLMGFLVILMICPGWGPRLGRGASVGRAGPENVSFSVWMKTMPLSWLAPC